MKYIIMAKDFGTVIHRVPIIFPNTLVHSDVAVATANILTGYEPVSAGEYDPVSGSCSGRSSTLGLEASDEDSSTILLNDYGAAFS